MKVKAAFKRVEMKTILSGHIIKQMAHLLV